jgi:wyosine [tRNA(Phe)-imidazoG37] synthetase (radical SAM superfamily)
MGGGKTHNMIALGLLASNPALRTKVLGSDGAGSKLGKVRVIGFNGRQSDAPLGIWGAIADQLGKKDQFKDYYSPLQAPGETAWINLLKGEPTLILLDELPPYMDYVKSRAIGNSDLSVVTTTALANLLVAVNKAELTNVCVIISDLTASYEGGTAQINKALANLQRETSRSALRIEPVNPHGDELYHILRTRLFEKLPDNETIKAIANEYAKAVRDAKEMDVTNASPDSYAAQIIESYPFHFSIRDLYGRFKENPGFQQTRGLIRMMRIFVSNMYDTGRADVVKLVHPYDIDLNSDEVFSEIKSINPSLSEAITHDIAKQGHSVAEELDKKLGSNTDTQDVCKLLLVASLANIPGATHGLRESDIMGFLCAPGRDISNVKKSIVDYLPTQAWYLHASLDGRLFFKNTQNLAAKLHSLAESYNKESCIKELRNYLTTLFTPGTKDCYQKVEILPGIDEVNIEADKVTLVITEPTTEPNPTSRLSPEWNKFAGDIEYKNRVVFLTGSHDTLSRVVEQTAQHKAVLSILADFDAERLPDNDPQRRRALISRDKIMLSLRSAIQETFTTLSYPSKNGFRSTDCRIQFQDNQFDGEQLIRDTLEKLQKFTNDISSGTFRKKCEARLFGGQQTAQWPEVKRRAATLTTWQFHRPDALETLRSTAINQDHWRDEGGYINKGPFPPPDTEVRIQRLSRDETTGEVSLKITPIHGNTVYYEIGDNEPTTASAKIDSFTNFKTRELQLNFLCVDSEGEHSTGSSEAWKNSISLKYRVYQQGDDWMVELKAYPRGNIRYTTDGSDPEGFGAPYDSPFVIPEDSPFVLAIARQDDVISTQEKINVKEHITKEVKVDPGQPVTWRRHHSKLTTKTAFEFMERLEKFQTTAYGVTIDVMANDNSQDISYSGEESFGLQGKDFEKLVKQLQSIMSGSQVELTIERLQFDKGQQLLDWIAEAKSKLLPGEVNQ